jgi:integrase
MVFLAALDGMGERGRVTPHGFRSSFKDWCSETTSFPGIVSEAALAHVVRDKTERAYRRGDLLEKRRRLMAAWARYCTERRGQVVDHPAASRRHQGSY